MESYELHLTDKHHLTCRGIVIAATVQVDKAVKFLQLLLVVGWQSDLSQTGYRDVIDSLYDTVTLVLRSNTDNGIPRTTLIDVLSHELEHK